jgi:hypothetical protein
MGAMQSMMQGGAGGGQVRMSARERKLQQAKEMQQEAESFVEEFLAAVDAGEQDTVSKMISSSARGTLGRLRDGQLGATDFDLITNLYKNGKVGESVRGRRSNELTVAVELPDRRRRVGVRQEGNNWRVASLDGVR